MLLALKVMFFTLSTINTIKLMPGNRCHGLGMVEPHCAQQTEAAPQRRLPSAVLHQPGWH